MKKEILVVKFPKNTPHLAVQRQIEEIKSVINNDIIVVIGNIVIETLTIDVPENKTEIDKMFSDI